MTTCRIFRDIGLETSSPGSAERIRAARDVPAEDEPAEDCDEGNPAFCVQPATTKTKPKFALEKLIKALSSMAKILQDDR